jgi:hypothetical protein
MLFHYVLPYFVGFEKRAHISNAQLERELKHDSFSGLVVCVHHRVLAQSLSWRRIAVIRVGAAICLKRLQILVNE